MAVWKLLGSWVYIVDLIDGFGSLHLVVVIVVVSN